MDAIGVSEIAAGVEPAHGREKVASLAERLSPGRSWKICARKMAGVGGFIARENPSADGSTVAFDRGFSGQVCKYQCEQLGSEEGGSVTRDFPSEPDKQPGRAAVALCRVLPEKSATQIALEAFKARNRKGAA
jgi:hypothetical protein